MNITREAVEKLVCEALKERSDLFVTDVKVKPDNTIYVFLDGDHGVNVDDCIRVSKHVENNLDRDRCDFELNVSSFGIGRPLQCFRQYQNAVGKSVSVKFQDGTKVTGKLLACTEQQLQVEIEGKRKQPSVVREIPMNEIKETKVEVSF